MSTRDTMLNIARNAILVRAALDGYSAGDYDPIKDPEGYVTSLLVGLRHWCHAHSIEWQAELTRAQELFEEDVREMLSASDAGREGRPASMPPEAPTITALPKSTHSRVIPLTKWNEYHEWPPLGGLRHLVFNANTNGFDKVMRKVGRRVLIDEDAFFEWVNKGGGPQ